MNCILGMYMYTDDSKCTSIGVFFSMMCIYAKQPLARHPNPSPIHDTRA